MSELPPLPEGATLDQPDSNLPPLPPGAVLDSAPAEPTLPPLPEGATLDQPMPGPLQAIQQGLKAGFEQSAQTGEVAAGNANPQPLQENSPAAAPFNMGDITSPLSSGLPKLAYKTAESYPMLVGAMAGGATTATIAPEIPGSSIPGMIMGTMGGAAIQTLGPAFARRLKDNPQNPDQAWTDAVSDTAKAGGFAGAGAGLLELNLFNGPVKNFLFQTFGVQPGVMVAQHAEQNVSEGKPAFQGAGQTYIEGSVFGAGLGGVHKGVELTLKAGKALTGRPGVEVNVPPPADLPPLPEGATLDQPPGPGGGEPPPPDGGAPINPDYLPPGNYPAPRPMAPGEYVAAQEGPTQPSGAMPEVPQYAFPNPLGALRRKIMGPDRGSQDNIDRPTDPRLSDPAEASTVLGPEVTRAGWKRFDTHDSLKLGDIAEEHSPYRWAANGDYTKLLNNTDLETHLALGGNAPAPHLRGVDIRHLDPSAITADVFDLPPANDTRVNLGEVPAHEYESMRQRIPTDQTAHYDYMQMVQKDGLRVAPSVGASFMYGDIPKRVIPVNKYVPGSHRSKLYLQGPNNDVLKVTPANHMPGVDHPGDNFRTVDMSMVPQDTFISGDSKRIAQLKFPEGMDEGSKDRYRLYWEQAADMGDARRLREFHKEGIYVEPHMTPDGRAKDSMLVAVKPIPKKAIVSGYAIGHDALGRNMQDPKTTGGVAIDRSKLSGQTSPAAKLWDEHYVKNATEIAGYIREIKPVIDNVLKRFGAKNVPDWIVQAGGTESPAVEVWSGRILFPSEIRNFTDARSFGTTRQAVYQIVMHEVGHLVTLRSWHNIPPDIKRSVEQSWERAKLKYNITNDPSSIMTVFSDKAGDYSNPQKAGYYLTFAEWHAEQFRRWMNGDPMVLSDADRYFQRGAHELKEYWDTAAKEFSPESVNQMFTADYPFHSYMDYLEQAARSGQSILQFSVAKLKVTMERPTSTKAYDDAEAQVLQAIKQFGFLKPEFVNFSIDRSVQPKGAPWGAYNDQAQALRLMVGSFAWIKNGLDRQVAINTALIHEAWHSVERWIRPEDRAMLLEEAKRVGSLPAHNDAFYNKLYYDLYIKMGADEAFARSEAARLTENEHIASLMEDFRNGARFRGEVNGFIQKLSDFFERIGNMLMGNGFKTVDDIMYSFHRGEITERINRANKQAERAARSRTFEQQARPDWKNGTQELTTPKGAKVWKSNDQGTAGTSYHTFYDEKGNVAGHLDVDSKGEIQMIYTSPKFRGTGLSETMLRSVEAERGEPFKTAQLLTREGYNFLRRRAPDRVKYYVKSFKDGMYYSPKMIWEMLDSNVKDSKDPTITDIGRRFAKEGVEYWGSLAKQIPDGAKEDPALANQWAYRNAEMDEWHKDARARNNDFAYQLTGRDTGAPHQDDFSATQRFQENEWKDKVGFIPQPELLAVNGIWRKYGEKDPAVNRKLSGTSTARDKTYTIIAPHWLPIIGNKMIALGKQALMIRQLAWKNPHIPELQEYISYRDQENARVQAGTRIADETLRTWDRLPDVQRDAVSELQFWATEMRYRSQAEVRAKVVRQPTTAELTAEARRLGLTRKGLDTFLRTQRDFANFLNSMEQVFTASIQRRFTDPAKAAIELAKLRADMVALRKKPYFPMTRFGKYSLTARDPNGKVVFFSLYPSAAERDAAVHQVYNRHGGLVRVSTSIVPEQVMDFMGMPGPMLDRIKQEMQPALSPQQVDWMERFAQLMAPEQSFKKRWLARKGTPGYSLDGVRAFAQYFRSGTRYLARLEFSDQIKETQRRLDNSVKGARDGTSRQIIADMVREHAKDMDAPGKEWGAFKAFVTNFRLGFSVKSAFMNMTQVPVVTYPYLASVFGERSVYPILKGSSAIRRSFQTTPNFKTPFLKAANDEMVAQGRIDIGQATELGIYANSDRMNKSYLGSRAQRALRDYSWYSMYMFGKTERASREWAFDAAMELALKNPTNRQVVDLALQKNMDLLDLIARKGWTHEQAQAFIFARETIDKTQFMYQAWDKPKFLRGKLGSSTRIFFTYTQQMLMAMTHNNPMRLRMMMMMGILYGASGLPGADDINSTIRALSKLLFGKDFNPEAEARKHLKDMSEGTIFDEIGPDLFLHGISRYSMGTAWMKNEYTGWPQFDLSGSGSMGSIIPGYKELMDGYATSGASANDWQNTSTKMLEKIAGPGFGLFFPMMQYMNSPPGSADQKKWEALLPTSVKAAVQWMRVMKTGEVTDNKGAAVAQFDMGDPNDRMTAAAAALGFPPRVMNELREANELQRDTDTYYKSQQWDLKVQLQLALERQSQEDIKSAMDGIAAYNKEVIAQHRPEYAMKGKDLLSSMKAREKDIARTEAGLPQSNQQIPLQQDTRKQFPGLIDSRNVK